MSGAVTVTNVSTFFEGVRFAREGKQHVDPINAGLWALAGYDPALMHCAEMRERIQAASEDDPQRISLDRFVSVYLEAQCQTLAAAAGVEGRDINTHLSEAIGETSMATTTYFAVGSTRDPLMLEVVCYAMYLGSFTAHGLAPWNKFAQVIADCFYRRHPLAPKVG